MSGVRRFHLHQLRHTFGCRWVDNGRNKEALQRICGHSTLRMTEQYGQVSDEFVAREVERLDFLDGRDRRENRRDSPAEAKHLEVAASRNSGKIKSL